MDADAFSDAAIILVGHGATTHAGSAAPAYLHGDELRRRGNFAEVTEAFVRQDPSLAGALRRVFSRRVFIVPLLVSDGWLADQMVPVELGLREPRARELRRVRHVGGRTVRYCRPVGSHPAMTKVLLARARAVLEAHPFPRPEPAETTLVIAGHGTAYSPGSRLAVESQVETLRRMGECEYAEVHGVYLEEPPSVDRTWELGGMKNLVLVPYFISDGLHTQEDIPVMLGEPRESVRRRLEEGLPPWVNPTGRNGRRLWYVAALGTEPLLTEVIMERVREAAGWTG